MRISIIDNGAGNLFNLARFIERVFKQSPKITSDPKDIEGSDLLVLPGVGNFRVLSRTMNRVRESIYRYIDRGGPLLAICLGMQALFEESEESGDRGLGVFKGRVIRIRDSGVKIPHIGWDPVEIVSEEPLWRELDGEYFYYAHSYHVDPEDKSIIVGVTRYGRAEIPAIVARNNIIATQFHPERSGVSGVKFARIISKIYNLG